MRPGNALITGGARRLGRAMGLDLAATGWNVAVHYNGSSDAAEETAADIRAHGVEAVALGADLLDEDATSGLVDRAAEALGGPLTLLINNASIFEDDSPASATRESWDRAVGSNLRAPFRLSQLFARQAPDPVLDANGEPQAEALIINMIDQRVLKPTPFFMSYTVAKMGLHAFTKTSAQAFAPRVRVMGIGPGPTIVAERQTNTHFANQRAACILQRGSNPEDIVAAMRFMIACPAVTGQMIAVDGGQHLAWQTPDIVGVPE